MFRALAVVVVLLFVVGLAWWWYGYRRYHTWNWDWRWTDLPAESATGSAPSSLSVRLVLKPQTDLADRPPEVFRITGLIPGQRVRVQVQTRDAQGRLWAAVGLWQADARGIVDLAAQSPLQGTYHRADPLGLVWSMRPVQPMRAPMFEPKPEGYTLDVTVEAGGRILAQTRWVRQLRTKGLICRTLREVNLVGAYCHPLGEGPFPGVLVLGGSEGGYRETAAAWWAAHGVAALSLAYFGIDPLPKALARIPIEYFLHALDWLRAQPEVAADRVFVLGASRGSEAALLTGIYADPPPAGVIAIVPSHVLWAGLDFSQGFPPPPAWTYQGQDLPYLTWGWSWDFLQMMVGNPARLRPVFETALQGEVPEDVYIPVEHLQARLLLISATDDQMWPSTPMAEALVRRMQAYGKGDRVRHLALRDAGHVVFFDARPPVRLIPPYLLGGRTREANVDAGLQAWKHIWAFVVHGAW